MQLKEKLTIRQIFITFFTWFLVGLLIFFEFTLFYPPILIWTLFFDRKEKRALLWVTKFFIKLFFKLYFISNFTIDLNGIKQSNKPRIYMLNHASQFDTFLMYLLPGRLNVFVKKIYTKLPFIGWTIKLSGYIYVNSNRNSFEESDLVDQGVKAIQNGTKLIIFPEGTKSKDGNIGRFKLGGFKIAYETKAEIVPVVLDTWNSIRPGGGGWIRDNKIWMKVLKPFKYTEYKNYDMKTFSRLLKIKMTEELLNIRNKRREQEKNYYGKINFYKERDNKALEKLKKLKNKYKNILPISMN